MKKITLIIGSLMILICISKLNAQTNLVYTDLDLYTYEELVSEVLLAPCQEVSNITYSGEQGLSYFYTDGDDFAFQSGIVMTTGIASDITGPSTGFNNSSIGSGGDEDLLTYIQDSGIDPMVDEYNDAVVLEFDFIPYSDTVGFNFLFASEEYGTFQCSFADAFAFFVTNTDTEETTNIALVPGTTTPVSVVSVRSSSYNGGCSSVNPDFFDTFYGGSNGEDPETAPINFRGRTVPMFAEANVEVGVTHHIKMVIADRNDSAFNSAVFLEMGSLDLGQTGGDCTPVNDDLCDAIELPLNYTPPGDAFNDVSATVQENEPMGSCWNEEALGLEGSVWFSFVAPDSGEVVISTDIDGGTQTDTQITVYEAPTDCTDLSTLGMEVACDDDGGELGDGTLSTVEVSNLTPGEVYYIQVDRSTAIDMERSSTDTDTQTGTFGISVYDQDFLSINDLEEEKIWSLYPNPVENTLTIKSQQTIERVEVYNMLGQMVVTNTPNNLNLSLDMSSLTTGSYFVKVSIGGVIETIRIIKK